MKYSLFTLELFLCASKNKSLAKTAMEKNLVVSAVSKRISDLESKHDYKYKSWDGKYAFNNKKSRNTYNYGKFKKCVFVGGDNLACFK